MEWIDSTRHATVRDIVGELERREIGANTVTFDGLDEALKRCLDSAGVTELVQQLHTGRHDHGSEQLGEDGPSTIPIFMWGGRLRRVPSDFMLPDCSVGQLWVLWQCGNVTKKAPSMKGVDSGWLSEPRQYARL
ncbi:hypothetical protein ON010_g7104 [Phytophthora cinnamomi]|nr:hypothetical protein ON010_g7104 [Phytophthora cinnamomi]